MSSRCAILVKGSKVRVRELGLGSGVFNGGQLAMPFDADILHIFCSLKHQNLRISLQKDLSF